MPKFTQEPIDTKYKFEEWKAYGIRHGFDGRNPKSLATSDKKQERSWYNKGAGEKWLPDFPFSRLLTFGKWLDYDSWEQYGLECGFDKRNPSSLATSDKKQERSWHTSGKHNKWLSEFSFLYKRGRWSDYASWEQYGIKQGFDKRDLKNLYASKDREDRYWYHKGSAQRWLPKFPFLYKQGKESLDSFISQTPEAQDIASLATITNDIGGIADILIQTYPGRFPSALELAISLPGAVRHIGDSLKPFTFDKARDFKERIRGLPSKVQYNLDNLLYSILIDQYQTSFNKNPKDTLRDIKKFTKDKRIKPLVAKVLRYYQDVYSFNIPGFGRMHR